MSTIKEIEDIDYSFPKLGKLKWVVLCTSLILFFVFISFPISNTIESNIKKTLSSIPGCQIKYQDTEFEIFLPKFIVNNVSLPMSCFGNSGIPINLKEVTLYFRGISFSPFGPTFKIETSLLNNPINAYLSAGIGGIAFNMQDNQINLSKFESLAPNLKLSGNILINALVKSDFNTLSDLKVVIQSKDFLIPSQSIVGLKIPDLALNNIYLKTAMDKKQKVKINEIIIGDTQASIRANFKGDLQLNQRNMVNSSLNLTGEVAFAPEFLETFAIIKLFMNKFTKKDEFYQIKVTGPLMALKTSSP